MSQPCVFFDRDGIVNVSPGPGYVERVEDFHLVPAFFDALRVALDRGYQAAIVTNQRGVGRGLMTEAMLTAIHDVLYRAVDEVGLQLLGIYYCTATDNAHPDRKPNPGMLLQAAREHDLALHQSWMIGDNESDMTAGRRAGCRATVLVKPEKGATQADYQCANMTELVDFLNKML